MKIEWIVRLGLLCCLACGGGASTSASGGAGNGPSPDGGSPSPSGAPSAEQVRQGVLAVLSQDPRLSQQTALTPDGYEALSNRIAAVPGVEASDYAGDTLGTIQLKVRNGGILSWRHLRNDLKEAATLPPETDFSAFKHPVWNQDWRDPVDSVPIAPPRPTEDDEGGTVHNTWATHFPVAGANPDYEYAADNAVSCPPQVPSGKIAIVDFLWTSAHDEYPGLYAEQYNVDNVMFFDRLQRMAAAGGFQLDVFKDDAINLGNFTRLKDYAIVFTHGHGGRPGVQTTQRLGKSLLVLATPELYSPEKVTAFGMTYEDAWKAGYIVYAVDSKEIGWTPLLFKDHYQPAVPQLVMLNECWTMLPFNTGFVKDAQGKWTWVKGLTSPLYNFGDALMDAGVKAVFGYVSPATPKALVLNTMPFFRRLFGGYSQKDLPPAPHDFWPTCMGVQTYFRLPITPQLAVYGNKNAGGSMYTMYARKENLQLRSECANGNPHAYLQDFMLKVGTPATALQICWDTWWSSGQHPNGLQDALCSKGDDTTTQQLVTDAACAVKVARKVTNAMLTQ